MSFFAQFESDCEECEIPIKINDECRMLDYERGLVSHVKCPLPPVQPSVCPKCFLTHNGECF